MLLGGQEGRGEALPGRLLAEVRQEVVEKKTCDSRDRPEYDVQLGMALDERVRLVDEEHDDGRQAAHDGIVLQSRVDRAPQLLGQRVLHDNREDRAADAVDGRLEGAGGVSAEYLDVDLLQGVHERGVDLGKEAHGEDDGETEDQSEHEVSGDGEIGRVAPSPAVQSEPGNVGIQTSL